MKYVMYHYWQQILSLNPLKVPRKIHKELIVQDVITQ